MRQFEMNPPESPAVASMTSGLSPETSQAQAPGMGKAMMDGRQSSDLSMLVSTLVDVAREIPSLAPVFDKLVSRIQEVVPGADQASLAPSQPSEGGILDKAVQAEAALMKLASRHPELTRDVQGAIAMMRREISSSREGIPSAPAEMERPVPIPTAV